MNNNTNPSRKPTGTPQNQNATPSNNKSAQKPPVQQTQAKRPAATPNTQNAKKPIGQDAAHRNKPKFSKNKDIFLAILALLLVVALAIIIIVCCIKAIADTIKKGSDGTTTPNPIVSTINTTGTQSTLKTDPILTTPIVGAWNEKYTTVSRNNTAIHEGDLLVVNYQYAYTFPASQKLDILLNKSYGWTTVYDLGSGMKYETGEKPVELSKHIIDNLATMLAELKDACPSLANYSERHIRVLSGYRTYEYQQTLYANETVEGLTAVPGHSEHHTGLAFDIRISEKDNSNILYLNDEEQAWITANCAKYGFILRYTDENKDITGILEEDWHFRYVGIPHAMYMVENDLCLEEYIDYLRESHQYGQDDPLNYTVGETQYTIYYFPASVENNVTNIPVPSSGYEISGNNIDGFIVTVTNN